MVNAHYAPSNNEKNLVETLFLLLAVAVVLGRCRIRVGAARLSGGTALAVCSPASRWASVLRPVFDTRNRVGAAFRVRRVRRRDARDGRPVALARPTPTAPLSRRRTVALRPRRPVVVVLHRCGPAARYTVTGPTDAAMSAGKSSAGLSSGATVYVFGHAVLGAVIGVATLRLLGPEAGVAVLFSNGLPFGSVLSTSTPTPASNAHRCS